MHLVVLDDHEAVASYVAAVASECGWTASFTTRETTFQALISAAPPDAIVLDLQLDTSDGIEQLHFLHRERYAGAVVLMSGFDERVLTSAQQIGDSLGLNIAAVLQKPMRPARVRDVLAEIERSPRPAPAPPMVEATPATGDITVEEVALALEVGRMELYLQPIVTAAGRAVTHAEGLIRWRDPVRGLVLPEQFVSIAEQNAEVIDRLSMWVVETGAVHYLRLAELGLTIQISINISGHNLRALDFPDRMAAVLERMAVPAGALGLELTETVAMGNLDTKAAILTRLRLKGFPLAIDDFGTGHSSLTVLRRLPFSAIKIDKSFVAEMESSNNSLMIVRSVIQLAHDMRLTSVAEGVAGASAARLLTELGIDSLQGYYFSQPLPFDRFAVWLREWTRGHAAA